MNKAGKSSTHRYTH